MLSLTTPAGRAARIAGVAVAVAVMTFIAFRCATPQAEVDFRRWGVELFEALPQLPAGTYRELTVLAADAASANGSANALDPRLRARGVEVTDPEGKRRDLLPGKSADFDAAAHQAAIFAGRHAFSVPIIEVSPVTDDPLLKGAYRARMLVRVSSGPSAGDLFGLEIRAVPHPQPPPDEPVRRWLIQSIDVYNRGRVVDMAKRNLTAP